MLEVSDCYVIADTIRFFSENDGASCLSLRHTEAFLFQLKPTPFYSENEHLGDFSGWHSEYLRCIVDHSLVQELFLL